MTQRQGVGEGDKFTGVQKRGTKSSARGVVQYLSGNPTGAGSTAKPWRPGGHPSEGRKKRPKAQQGRCFFDTNGRGGNRGERAWQTCTTQGKRRKWGLGGVGGPETEGSAFGDKGGKSGGNYTNVLKKGGVTSKRT